MIRPVQPIVFLSRGLFGSNRFIAPWPALSGVTLASGWRHRHPQG